MKEALKKGKIKRILSDEGEGGVSREAHLLEYDGKKYLLRICQSKATAKYHEKNYRRLEKYGFLPKLLYSEENKLIFEYIHGRDCKRNDAIKVAYEIGKIAGTINKIKLDKNEIEDFNKKFYKKLRGLLRAKKIDKDLFNQIKKKYSSLTKKVNPKIALEATDIGANNFRIHKGKVFLVDIEMLRSSFKGRGIAKGFIKWFKTPGQKEKFKEGYSSVSSMKFFTKDYETFIYIFYLVTNAHAKHAREVDCSKQIKQLKKVIIGNH